MTASWVVGCAIVIIGSTISNLGVNLQKYAHKKNLELPEKSRPLYVRSPWWMVGISFVLLGGLADFVALSFAPQCIIAALGSTTLIANVFFSKCLLKEKSTRLDLMATLAVVVGAILATFAADRSDKQYTLEQLITLAQGPRFLIYMAFVTILVTGLFLSLVYAFKNTPSEEMQHTSKFIPFAYAAIAGIFGAQSVLMAKMAGELIMEAFSNEGSSPFASPHSYLIFFIMFSTILAQTHFLNLGLRKFDALVIFPIFQVFWIVFGVIGGIIFFKEVESFQSAKMAVFVAAISLILLGVYFLAKHEMEQVFLPPNKFRQAVLAVMCANKLKKLGELHQSDSTVDIQPCSEPEEENVVIDVLPEEDDDDMTPLSTPSSTASSAVRDISFAWSFLGPETAILSADVSARNSSVLRNSVVVTPPASPVGRSGPVTRSVTRRRREAKQKLLEAKKKAEIEMTARRQIASPLSEPPSREPSLNRFKLTLQNSL